jgi:hypothetical protein
LEWERGGDRGWANVRLPSDATRWLILRADDPLAGLLRWISATP